MKNLKFRAWDKQLKRFEYFDLATCLPCYADESQFVVQQFTGSFDNSKKEIYEGDIINHGCASQYYQSVVDFYCGVFVLNNFFYKINSSWRVKKDNWDIVWEKNKSLISEGYFRARMSLSGDVYRNVIGNIYENEDLLS